MTAITVLTYNIRCGGEDGIPLITEVVRARRPDMIALMEASDRSRVETIARDLGMWVAHGAAHREEGRIAWLSRSPVQRVTNHRHVRLAKTLLEFATHLASRHDRQRPDEEVTVILDLLRPHTGQPHLLVGDFNAFHPADEIGMPPGGGNPEDQPNDGPRRQPIDERRRPIGLLLEAGYVDCYRTLHPRTPGFTYPAASPWLRIDYAFASPELAVHLAASDVVTDAEAQQASDHLPVWVTFRVAG